MSEKKSIVVVSLCVGVGISIISCHYGKSDNWDLYGFCGFAVMLLLLNCVLKCDKE